MADAICEAFAIAPGDSERVDSFRGSLDEDQVPIAQELLDDVGKYRGSAPAELVERLDPTLRNIETVCQSYLVAE
ncbi:MAG: hypothetical protein QF824_03415 [Candidatus Woesearchaeota archaeon]|jgi:hypothetical protein|nr:hypothetical protein [Candidatus Woesearchaeota archaeon]MDP7180292.1 hypothetical protein [Candidatus Woesearchaeota archaeon]|tara:strand:+ start:364 stop:588 length:225 start_codon:yes stop_codon:yes gene_type:complete